MRLSSQEEHDCHGPDPHINRNAVDLFELGKSEELAKYGQVASLMANQHTASDATRVSTVKDSQSSSLANISSG